ncbi:putative short-chain dehydrogenase [Plectosphaerella plurivora]|uniref:Short-chain dehydrogenase n=1 Tax=Plectosphaerella plurivora TaxID=936078 RepID=A0A9P8V6I1_9PEZI|nr:putative short-chain dehydrogenase [Plectosphaerella plurivora]
MPNVPENNAPPILGSAFTKTLHKRPYPAISPSRPELSQAGRTVLITGGHQGIGLAISRAFGQAKAARIIIVGRRVDLVSSSASQLSVDFPSTEVVGLAVDVTDQKAVTGLWDDLAKKNILVDVLVVNAAKFTLGHVSTLSIDEILDDYAVNVFAGVDFALRLHKQPGAEGRPKAIVNLSSLAIHDNTFTDELPLYSASKSAGTMLMQQLARHVSPEEMQVLSFHPGGIFTEQARNRGLSPDDPVWDDGNLCGQFAVWAASPEARFLHGRFVWAKWDVTELKEANVLERLEKDDLFLSVGVVGLREWNSSP